MEKQFDPKGSYKWSPEDVFTLTGEQFSIIYNSISYFMNSPLTPRSFTSIADASFVTGSVLKDTFENKDFIELVDTDGK